MTEQMKQALEKAAIEDTGKKKEYPISTQDACIHGVLIFLSILWKTASKKPDPYPNPVNTKMSWEFFARIARVEKWAYSEDILPV